MKNKVLEQKLMGLMVIVSFLGCFGWISWNVFLDLNFLKTAKYTSASILKIEKIHAYNPYLIKYSFFDEFMEKQKDVEDNIDGQYGRSIVENKKTEVEIAYTKNRIYYVNVITPSWRRFYIRLFSGCFLLFFGSIFIYRFIKGLPIVPNDGNDFVDKNP
jgi:hypothetical protein